jgi:hypothetical protein
VLKQRGFLSDNIHSLASAFIQMEMPYTHDVMVSIIEFALSDKETVDLLGEKYFLWIRGDKHED